MKLNPDKQVVENIRKALKMADGFCPCKPECYGDENYKCPCVDLKEDRGCCCNLYVEE
jgi:ferredoxin-thioredoxin reductase catalytic subunit